MRTLVAGRRSCGPALPSTQPPVHIILTMVTLSCDIASDKSDTMHQRLFVTAPQIPVMAYSVSRVICHHSSAMPMTLQLAELLEARVQSLALVPTHLHRGAQEDTELLHTRKLNKVILSFPSVGMDRGDAVSSTHWGPVGAVHLWGPRGLDWAQGHNAD